MTLYQMQLLLAVDECGSISGAAQQFGIAQPTASYQLQMLEDEVGMPLLVRRSRGMELTRAGRLVALDARAVFHIVDAIPARLASLEQLVEGPVSLGLSPVSAASTNHFPKMYRAFHEQFPRVEVAIVERASAGMVASLTRGEIDVAVMSLPILGTGMEIQHLWREELVVISAKETDIVGPVELRSFKDASWILFASGFGLTRTVVARCQNAGFDPRRVAEVSTMAAVIGFVSAGLGVAMVPREVAMEQSLADRVAIIPLDTPQYRSIALVTVAGKPLTPAARALADAIKRYGSTVK